MWWWAEFLKFWNLCLLVFATLQSIWLLVFWLYRWLDLYWRYRRSMPRIVRLGFLPPGFYFWEANKKLWSRAMLKRSGARFTLTMKRIMGCQKRRRFHFVRDLIILSLYGQQTHSPGTSYKLFSSIINWYMQLSRFFHHFHTLIVNTF